MKKRRRRKRIRRWGESGRSQWLRKRRLKKKVEEEKEELKQTAKEAWLDIKEEDGEQGVRTHGCRPWWEGPTPSCSSPPGSCSWWRQRAGRCCGGDTCCRLATPAESGRTRACTLGVGGVRCQGGGTESRDTIGWKMDLD